MRGFLRTQGTCGWRDELDTVHARKASYVQTKDVRPMALLLWPYEAAMGITYRRRAAL